MIRVLLLSLSVILGADEAVGQNVLADILSSGIRAMLPRSLESGTLSLPLDPDCHNLHVRNSVDLNYPECTGSFFSVPGRGHSNLTKIKVTQIGRVDHETRYALETDSNVQSKVLRSGAHTAICLREDRIALAEVPDATCEKKVCLEDRAFPASLQYRAFGDGITANKECDVLRVLPWTKGLQGYYQNTRANSMEREDNVWYKDGRDEHFIKLLDNGSFEVFLNDRSRGFTRSGPLHSFPASEGSVVCTNLGDYTPFIHLTPHPDVPWVKPYWRLLKKQQWIMIDPQLDPAEWKVDQSNNERYAVIGDQWRFTMNYKRGTLRTGMVVEVHYNVKTWKDKRQEFVIFAPGYPRKYDSAEFVGEAVRPGSSLCMTA